MSPCSSSPNCNVFDPFNLHLMCLGSSGSGLNTGKFIYNHFHEGNDLQH